MNIEIRERIEQINEGMVPEGYKETKVGIIPEDWEVERLGELGEFIRGKGIPKSKIKERGVDCIIYGEIYTIYDFFTKELHSKVEPKVANKSREIEYGDILFTSSGETLEEIGKCVMYLGYRRAVAGGDIVIIRPKDLIENKVSSYLLNSKNINKQKYKMGQGHSVVHLYASHLKDIKIPIIPLQEQEEIANILSTWDKAIEKTEKLIKEKEKQKKGLMQKLLTGETRLPGFSGEWEEVKLGETFIERSEKDYDNYELLAITMEKGIVKRSELDMKDTSSKNKNNYKRILPNDIGYNTMRMWQGVSGISNYKGIVSPAYTILTPKENINSLYFSYLFKLDSTINKFYRNSQGLVKDTLNLRYNDFKNISTMYPKDMKEQEAIANILSTADKEIELLNKLLENKKEEKKGLMQLLLTGILRV